MAGRKKTSDAQLAFGASPAAKPGAADAPPTPIRLYLVDASAYVYRAFHAIPFLSTSRGVPTNAAYGVTTMLLKLVKDERPTHLGLVFDAPGGSFRDELYAEYKANRSAMPDELVPQLGLIRRVVEALRPRVLEVPGVEADDVIGTLATRVAAAGGEVVIVTGDKDFQQLVGPRITLLDPMFDKRTGPDQVRERYGIEPERWVDVIGLMGDAIDNIPGIKGVGEKTASALIRHAGSLEALLADPERLATSGIRGAAGLVAKIRAHAEQAALAKQLATIRCDLALAETLDDFRYSGPDRAGLEELCREFEFHRLLREIPQLEAVSPGGEELACPVALDGREGAEVLPEVAVAKTIGFFVDATTASAMRAVPSAITVAPGADAHVTAPAPIDAPGPIRDALTSPAVEKVGEDVKRALIVLGRHGVALAGPLFDVGVASYVLDPSRASHGVDELARHFLGMAAPGEDAPIRPAWTARTALALRPVLARALEEHDALALFRDVEMPLLAVLAAMERRGVRVDAAALARLATEYRTALAAIEAAIYELAGGAFNINSPLQLREVLFDRLKIPTRGLRKGKTGISLDVDAMHKLAAAHPLPAKILEHRALTKLLSTYIDPLPQLVHPDTGRIHTSFNQTVAATGRLSSTDPNLQNIPIRTEEGRRIRAAFVPAPGKVLIGADYSQIELRVLAHLTGDPVLVRAFTSGEDIHTRTAAEVFDVLPALVTGEMRRRAKVINFGIIYGMGPQRLSRELAIPLADAQRYITSYFARLEGVTRFIEATLVEARRQGFVSTLLRRRRYLPELASGDDNLRAFAERTAINTPVQGSAADLIKLAMVKLEARLAGERLPAAMILQVHDELVFEADAVAVGEVSEVIRHEMETVMPLAVPLTVDVRAGASWDEVH
ncbi:MAG: DNA polymerase I [Deltaproteobacteria bacterium]|nr:DNA polymerase I [Deltaproteobacteria bacterium]